jgi:hypothetical protein
MADKDGAEYFSVVLCEIEDGDPKKEGDAA